MSEEDNMLEDRMINVEKVFRRIILLDFFVVVIPPVLWAMAVSPSTYSNINDVIIGNFETTMMFYILVGLYLLSLFLLYRFRPLGRRMYSIIIIFAFGLAFGIPVESLQSYSHFEYLWGNIVTILAGIILAMIYLTEIRKKFDV